MHTVNGVYVVQGEANAVVALLRKFRHNLMHRTALDDHDPLLRNFSDLCDVLNTVKELSEVNFDTFLSPFLEVVRSESTDGPVTARALSAIEKFVNYGLLVPNSLRITNSVQSIADSITKTKFIGATDNAIDECVLFQILQTTRALLTSNCGRFLTNETICELLQCCFRIGLESGLPILLRQIAESVLIDMTRLLHISLTSFDRDIRPCLKELIRFLIALINPLDKTNTPKMILMGLNLLCVVFEVGTSYIRNYEPLLPIIRDDLCRTLLHLLGTNKLPIFSATNRICFLLFESMRTHLKFQLEAYFIKLCSLISNELKSKSDSAKSATNNYALKEIALESLVQMWRIPNIVQELYLNYDCGIYCSNLFEDITKLLLQNSFPLRNQLLSIHVLSLDALLTVVATINRNCQAQTAAICLDQNFLQKNDVTATQKPKIKPHELAIQIEPDDCYFDVRSSRLTTNLPSKAELIDTKKRKQIMTEGSEIFNQSPEKGINLLLEKGLLKQPFAPIDVAEWLRHNPKLDKNKIADYICKRKNTEVLKAFINSFQFKGLRIDQALRIFLEAFRLPGEAAEISKIMQHFSEHWFNSNDQPFEDTDSAYTLAYAIIMLNTDQHNPRVLLNQKPMTTNDFKKNVEGTNNGKNFDSEMLELIYNAIKCDEIVLPAEQTGLVKENYIWKLLLKRGMTEEGLYVHTPVGWNDRELFSVIWGPSISALSYVFDKCEDDAILAKALNGYRRCAAVASFFAMSDVFDNLIIHLCKFSTLMSGLAFVDDHSNPKSDSIIETEADYLDDRHVSANQHKTSEQSEEAIIMGFAENRKAQAATKALFELVHAHGENLREGWKNILDCLITLFLGDLLPIALTNIEDFVDTRGYIQIRQPIKRKPTPAKHEGLLSWLGFSSNSVAGKNVENSDAKMSEIELIEHALKIITECHPEQLIYDSKFLTASVLCELLNDIAHISMIIFPANAKKGTKATIVSSAGSDDSEDQNPLAEKNEKKKFQRRLKARRLKQNDRDMLVFLTEFLVAIVLENRDRLHVVWPIAHQHLCWILSEFDAQSNPIIVERAIVALIRIANRNLFRLMNPITENEPTTLTVTEQSSRSQLADEILQSLFSLLNLQPSTLFIFSRQISYGLHLLLRTNAANIHHSAHWGMFFKLLEAVGAASFPISNN